MRYIQILIIGYFFHSYDVFSQDKLFLKNSNILGCKIVAISANTISYKDSTDYSKMITISKNDVLIAEYKSGEIYVFGPSIAQKTNSDIKETPVQKQVREIKEWKEKDKTLSNSILGFYLLDLFLGKITVSYERLLFEKSLGIKIPLTLTYDLYGNSISKLNRRQTSFVSGIDLNYYYYKKPNRKHFFGPRTRYGPDMLFGGSDVLSFQVQHGILFSHKKHLINSISGGVGFLKLSGPSPYYSSVFFPWASFTWRIGFRL